MFALTCNPGLRKCPASFQAPSDSLLDSEDPEVECIHVRVPHPKYYHIGEIESQDLVVGMSWDWDKKLHFGVSLNPVGNSVNPSIYNIMLFIMYICI